MENSTAKKASHLGRKILLWFITIVVVALAVFCYFRFYFVFGDGVKSGQLNFIVRKGYVFKTYEGRMIQVGYRSAQGTIQSNEFEFSVTDPAVAAELERSSGKILDLYYKEYLGRLPWRGMTQYVVYKVEAHATQPGEQAPPVDFSAGGQ